jgi:NAD(P)-dependent dehydrogenase (short-subunit alcohol dehydrogenase family)
MMAVDLRGAWLVARAFVPAMQARGYGKVINISSGTSARWQRDAVSHYRGSGSCRKSVIERPKCCY